ncbi:MAG: valine--tRNA ligase [Acidobacteriota bacterium]
MDKRFEPSSYEGRWQRFWAEQGCFEVDPTSGRPAYCIMIPPPNVTGKLHMGHALQSTLQDLLTRWMRMKGCEALWLPGTDHAGIATQLMVERQLAEEGHSREEMGREKFLERMWSWKEQYQNNIQSQLQILGASCDWSRERFTLDEGLSQAVQEAFVRLWKEGLITRGEYMVNWSPVLGTAVSDLEVEMRTVEGKLYHLAYPIEGSEERIVVATTRPETMLGDTAVAMHPGDERYTHLKGKAAVLPLVGRRLPLIEDEAVDREFGTGLVKITPAHDPNDFEMGRRHDLPSVQVIGRRGRMTEEAGTFAGLDRFEARERVVAALDEAGLLVKVERHTHNVGHSQRGDEPIEPLVSTQWFLDVAGMAGRALEAVEEGDIELVPATWEKTWRHWLENIRPWCISRQLWWGHQIPAWYDADGRCYVAASRAEAEAQAGTAELNRDPDVLDTWFSSGLWPFSTLGWPEETDDLKAFYPTDVLVTGFDILFFWVARMAMFGLHFTDEVPFRRVHLTGLVRDAEGVKMSKTKGNVLDPADLVEDYGADALRFTLAILDTPGNDIPMDLERMAGYRAFGNKIWNATRFALSRVGDAQVQEDLSTDGLAPPERWILSRLHRAAEEVNEKLEIFRFDEACNRLYHFFWGELCDWYIELAKPSFFGDAVRPRVGEVLLTVLDRSLRLLHPVMPHLTEELWQRLPGRQAIHPLSIALAPFPEARGNWRSDEVEARMEGLMELVTRVRALRAELNVPPKEKVRLVLDLPEDPAGDRDSAAQGAFLMQQEALLESLLRAESVEAGEPPEGAVTDRIAGVRFGLVIPERELGEDERQRLAQELAKIDGEIANAEKRLSNEGFLAKAPPAVVEGSRQRLRELGARRAQVAATLGVD